jgi:adenylate cyclase
MSVKKKKTILSTWLNNRSLQSYILFEVLLLLLVVISILTFFSKRQSEKDFQTFSIDYVEKFNLRLLNYVSEEVATVSKIPLHSATLLIDHIHTSAQDLVPNFESSINRYFKEILAQFPQLTCLYVASDDGAFFQIRRITENDYYILQENKLLPVAVSYSIRVIRRGNESRTTEQFYYFDELGTLIDSEENLSPIYDPRNRPWYIDTLRKRSFNLSNVYLFGTIPHLVMTSSTPIIDRQENIKAIMAADINIRDISILLEKKKLTQNSISYIISKKSPQELLTSRQTSQSNITSSAWNADLANLEIIASSERESPMMMLGNNARVLSLDETKGLLWRALEISLHEKEEAFFADIDGTAYLVNIMPFSQNFGKEWQIVTLVPYTDLTSLLFSSKEDMISLYIFILFISCLQVLLLARRIAYPIEDLREEALKIKKFNLDGGITVSSNIQEVQALAQTMKDMKVSLKSFTKYMPHQLVLSLIKRGDDINIGGEAKKITIFFSDIANFTTISESMAPQDLMVHLSEYFEYLTSIIIQEKGTVDKYIGDAIMAFWGAPTEDPDQTYHACRTALLCQHKLAELNKKWKLQGLPVLETRIGINVGEVIVGNVGCSERMNYTIIGDSVNLASRLEGVNKYYGTNIIISDAAYELIKNKFLCRTLDIVAVKVKQKEYASMN